jgi:DNA polymerase I-like protein with 3'-5' exonuclease and polymerase domains
MCELTGIKRDIERTKIAQGSLEKEIASEVDELQTILGKGFNPNSPAQKLKLIKILGYKLAKNADEKALKKCAYLHPLNALIVGKILAVVKKIKLLSTYLTVGKEFNGRIIYSLDPTGTDTGRYSSRESSFWCGLQIHNIPRGKTVKQTLQSDPDFILCESDYEQAESRDVAYLSGSEKLINAVSGQDDFHSVNASAFFGVSYSSIRDNATGKTINKPLRDLAKRVNHGVTYVMGEAVLVDTMGWNAIEEARKLLKLPANWGYLKVAAYLINSYHRTYPELEAIYYPAIQREVLTTSKLTSQLGWTRYCFGKPDRIRAKTIYNSYVAHKSQSLNAEKLDMAFMKIFYSHMINPEKRNNIRVLAQIHDSLLFQVRKTHLHYCEEIKNAMEIPATITGADKKNRTYIVPASLKTPAEYWSDLD